MAPALIQDLDDDVASETPSVQIALTPVESIFRNLLLDVARYVDQQPQTSNSGSQPALIADLRKDPIILRFTGGWVRDKLLGTQSHDIDVAINKMTGYQFGLNIKSYLEIPGNLEKYGLEAIAGDDKQDQKAGVSDKSKSVGGLHKIEANPEKSKHLETTTMRILGLDVDLVNLRKETYSEDSRNPQMQFGTPEEDAMRRDATVNALFYNINTEQVEDLTGRGHKDMQLKVLRTPLDPYQTFKDDPLRVLRLIRFASRLGYSLDPSVSLAMKDPEIKDALRRKISRERVGTELEKSLQGPDPREALSLIFDHGLYQTIFSDPSIDSIQHFEPDLDGWQTIISTLDDVIRNSSALTEQLIRDHEEEYLAWQLTAFVPFRHAPQPELSETKKKSPPPIAVAVAREGIKATGKVCDLLTVSIRHQNEIASFVDGVFERKRRSNETLLGEDVTARDVLGMAIRRWGPSWRSQVTYAFAVEVANNLDNIKAIERKYISFVNHIVDLELLDICSVKPLLDGKALAKALSMRPGPWMKEALEVVMAWQLRNRDASDPTAAIEEVKSHQTHGELTSSLVHHFLKLTIRPLFMKASPSSVTPQGRKATTAPLPTKLSMQAPSETETKPWKTSKADFACELLDWVTRRLDPKLLEDVWPLIIPPILTLLDDWEIQYKVKGVQLLGILLHTTSPALLKRTGLGEVFESALLPCVTYLPPLVPEGQSHALLGIVYPTLLTLSRLRFPAPPPSSTSAPLTPSINQPFHDALSTIIRKGIIYSISHLNPSINHPFVLRILLSNLVIYLDELGINAVKHLQYLIPITTEILAHPLGGALSLETLLSAVLAQQAIIRNCWPRMENYRAEILKGLAVCWLEACGSGGTSAQHADGLQSPLEAELRHQLRSTVNQLRAALTVTSADMAQSFDVELQSLLAVDGHLLQLFERDGLEAA